MEHDRSCYISMGETLQQACQVVEQLCARVKHAWGLHTGVFQPERSLSEQQLPEDQHQQHDADYNGPGEVLAYQRLQSPQVGGRGGSQCCLYIAWV